MRPKSGSLKNSGGGNKAKAGGKSEDHQLLATVPADEGHRVGKLARALLPLWEKEEEGVNLPSTFKRPDSNRKEKRNIV